MLFVARVGNAQPRPSGYEPDELTSALPRDVISLLYKNCAKLTNLCKKIVASGGIEPPLVPYDEVCL